VNGDTELLALRLALIAVLFAFVAVSALTMRSGLMVRSSRGSARASAVMAGPRLVLERPGRTGIEPGAAFALAGIMTIGRDAANGIMLADVSVSGRHATIEQVTGGWKLADLGSTNGTFVNGGPVDGRGVLLRGGERLMLGTIVLRLQL
jgi:hypothetical protein